MVDIITRLGFPVKNEYQDIFTTYPVLFFLICESEKVTNKLS